MNIPDARSQRLLNAKIRSEIYYRVLDELSSEIANAKEFPLISKDYAIPRNAMGWRIPDDICDKLSSYGWSATYGYHDMILYNIQFNIDVSNSRTSWMFKHIISLVQEMKYWRYRE